MDDLIYSFLLQSNYPRSCIVFDVDLLSPRSQGSGSLKVPSFIIVDPESAEPLAVIEVVEALDGEELKQAAIETGAYASRLADKNIQGFLISVDAEGRTEEEQIQFYRIWPNSTLLRLSSRNFPDLETLRVSRKLTELSAAKMLAQAPLMDTPEIAGVSDEQERPGAGLYLPGFILLVIILIDGVVTKVQGAPMLTMSQSVMAFGAALLLTLPAAIRYLRSK
ncbi:MAG: hypothetical protein AB8B63_16870 [Granulosicoccus sp.]